VIVVVRCYLLDPRNRVALLTGASYGIGAATAHALMEAGCRVALVARSADVLNSLAGELRDQGGEVLPLPADISDRAAAERAVEQTVEIFGGLDILINNAGVGLHQPSLDAAWDDIHQLMAVNWMGPLALIRAAVPVMRGAGGGLIVNVTSIIGRQAVPRSGIYCASKAALERLGDSLRIELASQNIRVVTVYPGLTRTDFSLHTLGFDRSGQAGARSKPYRVPTSSPERVARTIVRAIRREPRDAYVTLVDWVFVTFSTLFPGILDSILRQYFAWRNRG
jgi:short-subunit dehydrogenase